MNAKDKQSKMKETFYAGKGSLETLKEFRKRKTP